MAKKKLLLPQSTKKQIKQELAGKIETAVLGIKEKLGNKKFEKRVKKATKLFVAGLHNKDFKSIAPKKVSP